MKAFIWVTIWLRESLHLGQYLTPGKPRSGQYLTPWKPSRGSLFVTVKAFIWVNFWLRESFHLGQCFDLWKSSLGSVSLPRESLYLGQCLCPVKAFTWVSVMFRQSVAVCPWFTSTACAWLSVLCNSQSSCGRLPSGSFTTVNTVFFTFVKSSYGLFQCVTCRYVFLFSPNPCSLCRPNGLLPTVGDSEFWATFLSSCCFRPTKLVRVALILTTHNEAARYLVLLPALSGKEDSWLGTENL